MAQTEKLSPVAGGIQLKLPKTTARFTLLRMDLRFPRAR